MQWIYSDAKYTINGAVHIPSTKREYYGGSFNKVKSNLTKYVYIFFSIYFYNTNKSNTIKK